MTGVDTATMRDRFQSGAGTRDRAASEAVWSLCAEVDRLRAELASQQEHAGIVHAEWVRVETELRAERDDARANAAHTLAAYRDLEAEMPAGSSPVDGTTPAVHEFNASDRSGSTARLCAVTVMRAGEPDLCDYPADHPVHQQPVVSPAEPAERESFWDEDLKANWDHEIHVGYINFVEHPYDSARQVQRNATVTYDINAHGIVIGVEIMAGGPNSEQPVAPAQPPADICDQCAYGADCLYEPNCVLPSAARPDIERHPYRGVNGEGGCIRWKTIPGDGSICDQPADAPVHTSSARPDTAQDAVGRSPAHAEVGPDGITRKVYADGTMWPPRPA